MTHPRPTARRLAASAVILLFMTSMGFAAATFAVLGPGLFWVGGAGNINDPTHYALKSGGVGGAGLPSQGTALVTFDGNSGTGTVVINAKLAAQSITLNAANITLSDSAGMALNGTFSLISGAFISNGMTENWGAFSSSSSSARTLTVSNSVINLNNSITTAFTIPLGTGLTVNNSGSTINLNGEAVEFSDHSTTAWPNIVFTICSSESITAVASIGNLTLNCNRNSWIFDDSLNVPSTTGITVTGTLTANGFSQRNRLVFYNNSASAAISAANTVLSNLEFRNIAATGSASWVCNTCGDDGGNSGITFQAARTLYWILNSGLWSDPNHWSLSSGGPSSGLVPYAQDMARFDQNSFTLPGQSVVMDYSEYSSWDWTGVTHTPNLAINVGGNWNGVTYTFSPNMTTSGGVSVGIGFLSTFNRISYYRPNSTATLTMNGVNFAAGIGVNANGGTLQLGGDFHGVIPSTVSQTESGLVMSAGTFNSAGFNVSFNQGVVSSGTLTRAINTGSGGTWTLSQAAGTVWTPGSTAGFTYSGSAKFLISGVPTAPRTFVGSGLTYSALEWAVEGVTSTLAITGANNFSTLTIDGDVVARTFVLPASTTQTVGTGSLSGTSGGILAVNSSTPGTAATISGTSVSGTELALTDQVGTGAGSPFNATHSTIVSNVTGWAVTP